MVCKVNKLVQRHPVQNSSHVKGKLAVLTRLALLSLFRRQHNAKRLQLRAPVQPKTLPKLHPLLEVAVCMMRGPPYIRHLSKNGSVFQKSPHISRLTVMYTQQPQMLIEGKGTVTYMVLRQPPVSKKHSYFFSCFLKIV